MVPLPAPPPPPPLAMPMLTRFSSMLLFINQTHKSFRNVGEELYVVL